MYKEASRLKLKFSTTYGRVGVERLWDLNKSAGKTAGDLEEIKLIWNSTPLSRFSTFSSPLCSLMILLHVARPIPVPLDLPEVKRGLKMS